MKFTIQPSKPDWWFWFITLALLIAGFAWDPLAFQGVAAISLFQILYFTILRKSLIDFSTQVRIFYALIAVGALFDPTHILFAALIVGTMMVTFFDRCILARILVHMPWNRGIELT